MANVRMLSTIHEVRTVRPFERSDYAENRKKPLLIKLTFPLQNLWKWFKRSGKKEKEMPKFYSWSRSGAAAIPTAPMEMNIRVGGSDTGTTSITIKLIRPVHSSLVLLVNPRTQRIALKDAYELGMPSEDFWVNAVNGMVVDCTKTPPEITAPQEKVLVDAGILVY